MTPEAFGVQVAGAGGDLLEAWQGLLATQALTLVALVAEHLVYVEEQTHGSDGLSQKRGALRHRGTARSLHV
jgi:hypothetical protein